MNITLCSSFRTSGDALRRYYQQAQALRYHLQARGDTLHFVWGEGDSRDGTLTLLKVMATELGNAQIVDCAHGGPAFGSVVNAARFKQLAYVASRVWAAIPADSDVVVWVESDLIWDAATMTNLIDQVAEYGAISPMVLLARKGWSTEALYDTWAFRLNGEHFEHHPPYHTGYNPDQPFRVDSAGSCMAMRGDIAQRITFDDNTLFSEISRQISFGGSAVYVDPGLAVRHL
jgi:hypothetical protein